MRNERDLQLDYDGRRVLVTGGLGFIGSHLARRLVSFGARVTLVDSLIPEYGGNLFNVAGIEEQVRINVSDVRDRYSMHCLVQRQDILFNLAGQTSHLDSMLEPEIDLEINCRAQLSILEACRHHNPALKVVFASTRQIYGVPERLPVDESHPIRPVDVNGINKLAGEQYHMLYNNVYGVRATAARLTNTYGPCMRIKDARQTFLGSWIRQALLGEPFEVWGTGEQLRDFNYVDDAVDALLVMGATEAVNGQAYNLGSDERISLRDLASTLVRIAGAGSYRVVPFPPERKVIDIGDYYGSYDKLRTATGWRPQIDFETGLARTVQFFKRHLSHYAGEG